jgi:hypothetical protein
MPQKIYLKLKAGAHPHLFVDKIKEMISKDDYLHPGLKNALLLMKKTRMPYIILATIKEIILVPEKGLHLERAIEPSLTGYFRIDWTKKEKESYIKDPKKYIEDILAHYYKLGYDITPFQEVPMQTVDAILATTKKMEEKK